MISWRFELSGVYCSNKMVLWKLYGFELGQRSFYVSRTEYSEWNICLWQYWNEEKILGVIIDNKLRFKSHVKNLCKKASQKIWALSRLINYLNDSKKKIIFNALIKSQFSYCPLVWMFCSRQTNNMINYFHSAILWRFKMFKWDCKSKKKCH